MEWLVGDAPFYLKFWVEGADPASKTAIFQSIFNRSGSKVGASEKSSIMTTRSSVRAFQ